MDSIERRKSEVLSRMKIVTKANDGRVDDLGFELSNEAHENDFKDSIYLVDEPETVMKLKHYINEVGKKHRKLAQNAPDFLFFNVLPTTEWIETLFSERKFSKKSIDEGEKLYKRFAADLPPCFTSKIRGG
jgi:hypothetical protein